MRDGWKLRTLQEVAVDFGRGKSKHRPRNDPALYGGVYPFIQTGDVRSCNHTIVTSSQSYNDFGLAQSKLWPKGTICITIAANIAETGILSFDACFPDSIIGIVVDESITTNDYVEYLLQSMKSRIQSKGKGSAQDNINLATFKNELFPFPPLPEQKRIVAILDEVFAAIDKAVANTEKNLANARELFESYLDGVFTRKSEGWEEKKLSDFAVSISTGPFGSLLHKSDYVSSGVPLVNPVNIVGNNIVADKSKLINEKTKKRLLNYVLREGDIVIGRRGEIGRCAAIQSGHDGWVCGTGCFFVRPLPTVLPAFLVNLIRSRDYREKLEKASTGATMKNLSNKNLANLVVAIPNIEVQTKTIARLDALFAETQHLESTYHNKLIALAELKQSILQKAFSGELTTESSDLENVA